jgi:excisionase family DNA binding protein
LTTTTAPPLRKLLTPEEIAKRLSLPKRSIYNMVRDGELPGAIRVGRRLLRFDPDVVDRWLAAKLPPPKSRPESRPRLAVNHPNKFGVALDAGKVAIRNLPLQALQAHDVAANRWPAPAPLTRDEAITLGLWLLEVTGHGDIAECVLDDLEGL